MWVAVAGSTPFVIYSYDAIVWNNATLYGLNFDLNLQVVVFGKTQYSRTWVAGGLSPQITLIYSIDGLNWVGASSPRFSVTDIEFNGSLWVAVGTGVNGVAMIVLSYDGIHWTEVLSPTVITIFSGYSNSINTIFWNNSQNQWIASGTQNTNATIMATSSDAVTWTAVVSDFPLLIVSMAGSETGIIATGSTITIPANQWFAIKASNTSPSDWNTISVSNQTVENGNVIVFNNSLQLWVICSYTGVNVISYSNDDGVSWESSSVTGQFSSIATVV